MDLRAEHLELDVVRRRFELSGAGVSAEGQGGGASERAIERSSDRASKRASEQASKRASEQASKRGASGMCSERTCRYRIIHGRPAVSACSSSVSVGVSCTLRTAPRLRSPPVVSPLCGREGGREGGRAGGGGSGRGAKAALLSVTWCIPAAGGAKLGTAVAGLLWLMRLLHQSSYRFRLGSYGVTRAQRAAPSSSASCLWRSAASAAAACCSAASFGCSKQKR